MRILISDTTWHSVGVARALEERQFLASKVQSVDDLMQFIDFGSQDAIILDTDLPDHNIREVLGVVRRLNPEMPVLVINTNRFELTNADLINAGADEVIELKPDFDLLSSRIRTLVRRAAGFASPVIDTGALNVDIMKRQVKCLGEPIELTRIEYEIVEMMALRPNRYLSREDFMNHVYGWEDEPSDKIIDVYFSRIRSKFEEASLPRGAITSARSRGHMLPAVDWPDFQAA